MTETPGPQQAERDPNGLDTENLRNYTQLRRTTYDRKIAGVAGGLGRHLNIDPVIVRVLLVVLVFFGGAGIILYGAAWLLVPEDNGQPAAVHTSDSTRNTLLIIAAAVAGLCIVGDSWGGFGFPWPLFVIALVVFAVMMSRDNSASPDAPAPYAAPHPGASYAGGDQPLQYAGRQYGWQPVAPTPPPAWQPPRKRGPLLFGYTLALIAIGLGALGLYDALATNQVADAAYPAMALGITGVMLVVGSFFGRPGGLMFVGTIAAIALAGAAIVNPRFDGDRVIDVAPSSAGAVQDHYQVPAGQITLDLSDITEPTALDGRTIHLEATAGEIIVILPREGISAEVNGDIDFGGQIDIGDESTDGFGRELHKVIGDGATTIDLDIDLKFGHIEVRQAA